MTHYTISYANLSPQAKHLQAIADTKEYLGGEAKFTKLVEDFRQYPPQRLTALEMYLSLIGVQGYPVQAMHDEIWPFG